MLFKSSRRSGAPLDPIALPSQAAWRFGGIGGNALMTALLGALIAQWAMAWLPRSEVEAIQTGERMYSWFGQYFVIGLNWTLVVLLISLWIARRMLKRVGLLDRNNVVTAPLVVASAALVLWQAYLHSRPWGSMSSPLSLYTSISIRIVLELTFVASTIVALHHALAEPTQGGPLPQRWQPTIPLEAREPSPGRPATFGTTVSIALGLYSFLRGPLETFGTTVSAAVYSLLREPLDTVEVALATLLRHAGLALVAQLAITCFAAVVFRRSFEGVGIVSNSGSRRAAKVACGLLLLYVVIAVPAAVLSAIPYGGGYVPPEVRLVASAAQAFGGITLFLLMQRRDADDREISDDPATVT